MFIIHLYFIFGESPVHSIRSFICRVVCLVFLLIFSSSCILNVNLLLYEYLIFFRLSLDCAFTMMSIGLSYMLRYAVLFLVFRDLLERDDNFVKKFFSALIEMVM